MSNEQSHLEQGQVERAKRLHDSIERLKRGQHESGTNKKPQSLKEQIEERAAEPKK